MYDISKLLYNLVNGLDTTIYSEGNDNRKELIRTIEITNSGSVIMLTSTGYKLPSKNIKEVIIVKKSLVSNEEQLKLFLADIICNSLNSENTTLEYTKSITEVTESKMREIYSYASSMLNLSNEELDMWERSNYNGKLNLLLSKEIIDSNDIPVQCAYLDIESKIHDIKSRLFNIKRLNLQMTYAKNEEYQKALDELNKYINEDKGYAKTLSN